MPQRHSHRSPKRNPNKKKIDLFYKVTFFLLLLVLIVLSYFVILVSTKPKSIPFVTQKIESTLQEKFGPDVSLSDSLVSFTRYGTLKVTISSLKILYILPNTTEKQALVIPKLESEFSLFNLLIARFHPSKIKIIDATIVLDDLQKMQQQSNENDVGKANGVSPIIHLLSSIRTGKSPIENFEIENAKLLVKGQEFETTLIIKKSQISTSVAGQILHISTINKVSFDADKSDVDFNSSCQLSKDDGLKCDLVLENFVANSIADLDPSLEPLNKINAALNATASFVFKNGEMGNILFQASAQKGDFEFLNFFSRKMDFSNLSVKGEYDNKLGILNLSEIKTDIIERAFDYANIVSKPHLEMSLLISDLKNPLSKKMDFYIRLQDVPNAEMDKFWPSALSDEGVRRWVLEHIKNGMIKNAYAKFSLTCGEKESVLESMDSQLTFSGFDIKYSEDFPPISDVGGVANFTKKSMNIAITNGDVLNSKISEGLVVIEDFYAPVTMLKVSGKSHGHASDTLKHVDYKSDFASEISKYLNGNSQNDFDIRMPLDHEITLKNTYIAVSSDITNLDNPYLRGGVAISAKKDFSSTSFNTNVDLTAAEIVAKNFDITKRPNVSSGLNLIAVVDDPKRVLLKNISLWKKEEITLNKKTVSSVSKIDGNIAFNTAPFLVTAANFKNSNFGKNNYTLSYNLKKENGAQKISLKAQKFNFASFLENKFFQNSSGNKKSNNLQLQVAVDNLILLNNKSVKNFSLSLNCDRGFCNRGLLKGNYSKKQVLNLRAVKKPQEDFVTIDGEVPDIGYLAESLGISNKISGGGVKLKMTNKLVNKKSVLDGEIEITDDITIYETAAVKRLSSNDLFSQVKDKIFSKEKITFDSLKMQFSFQDTILNIHSLVANNYKIGITAKGIVDLKNDTYEIKGMIVPGFIINNLFGIGKIPFLGGVISGLLTGGEGGGLFGIHYEYNKKKGDKEATFETNKVSAFVPTTIKSLVDLI